MEGWAAPLPFRKLRCPRMRARPWQVLVVSAPSLPEEEARTPGPLSLGGLASEAAAYWQPLGC